MSGRAYRQKLSKSLDDAQNQRVKIVQICPFLKNFYIIANLNFAWVKAFCVNNFFLF